MISFGLAGDSKLFILSHLFYHFPFIVWHRLRESVKPASSKHLHTHFTLLLAYYL
jgi:hypothetical protein